MIANLGTGFFCLVLLFQSRYSNKTAVFMDISPTQTSRTVKKNIGDNFLLCLGVKNELKSLLNQLIIYQI
jgi:hypothetical protein